jgi:hypothetical protein
MFVFDSAIGCIAASESEVLDLYRSLPAVMSAAGSEPVSMEAYVCAIKEKTGARVYLALVADNRKIYVYTKPGKSDSDEGYQHSVEEALALTKSMGFSPEPVNLSYGPAMREVVVRNIKIFRSRASKVGLSLKNGLPGAPALPNAKTPQPTQTQTAAISLIAPAIITPAIPVAPPTLAIPIAVPAPSIQVVQPAPSIPVVQPVPSIGVAPPAPLTQSPPVDAQISTPAGRQETPDADERVKAASAISELQYELRIVATEKDAQLVQLQQLSALHRITAAELAGARDECARVTAERDTLVQVGEQLESVSLERSAVTDKLQVLAAQHRAATTELVNARQECARLTEERDALAQVKKELEAVAIERDVATDKLQELSERQQAAATELIAARELSARLTEERDALKLSAHGAEQASSESASLQKKVAALSKQVDRATHRNVELTAQCAALAETAANAEEHAKTLAAERDAAVERIEHLTADNGSLCSQEEALRGELASLRAEKEAALLRIGVLEQQKVSVEVEVDALRQKLELLAGEREILLEKNRELTRVADATIAAATDDIEHSPAAVRVEVAKPGLTQDQIAAPDGATFTASAEARFQLPEFQDLNFTAIGTENLIAAPASQAVQVPAVTGKTMEFTALADLHDFFPADLDGEASPGRFLLNAGLKAIEYSCLDDVVELHQSINNAYLSPDGKGQESCRGYICTLKKGTSMQVFAALLGIQSGRTSVYVPEVQPDDEQSYARTIRGAISFAEEVGLMMEPVKLGASSLQQQECLTHCPVLRSGGQN